LKRIFLTGVSGFIGAALACVTHEKGFIIRGGVRSKSDSIPSFVEQIAVGNIIPSTNWQMGLDGSDIVIHLAARVHIMQDTAKNPLSEFRRINTEATLNLARQAVASNVKRFIYLSSIKVNGELTSHGVPFTPDDDCVPTDPYGLSKYEAEQGLLALAQQTGMEVVIIRPPLVYGPGVKANFASMMKWMDKPVLLPFSAIYNQRSLVALDNLVSFISLCADREKSPLAVNQVFLISDGEDVSTTQLLRKVRQALHLQSPSGTKARLVPVPVSIMTFFAKLLGKGDMVNRLFGSLQVDSSKASELLGWEPVITMDEQLAKITKDIQR